ncbi:hypothetical protein C5C07_16040 [Haloferax sp. Atlit-4N]|uniref:hypothetical protein n=1 Tax=Haloferax sp. Atlit-4N TaxID=2077206 RepID=UPI000E24EDF0|nr:hypothetical protein [Haloferax sp. Atlit-4N]RDZ51124.1 hypothetical protein C5C07_16040 [Haloferax sp. Atlit-4N]
MRRTRVVSLALLLAVVVNAGVASVGLTSAEQAKASISGAYVSTENPSPGQQFTVTTNVTNVATSSDSITLTDMYVRSVSGTEEHARVEDVGSISPGNTLSVPLSLSLSDVGTHNLRVHAVVRSDSGDTQHLKYPLLITVTKRSSVMVSVQASEPTANTDTPVNVTVANGDSNAISTVRLQLSGNGSVVDPERVTGSIDPGVDRTFRYNVTFEEAGPKTLNATATYTTNDGSPKTVSDETVFSVVNESDEDQLEGRIQLVGVETSGDGIVTIQGDAANVGGTNVKSVLLRVEDTASVSPMGASGEYFVGAVNDSKFDTFELITRTKSDATEVPIRVRYLVDGERRTDTVTVNLSSTSAGAGAAAGPAPNMGGPNQAGAGPSDRRSQPQPRSGGALGGLGGLVLPLVAVVALGGGAYVLWKRR